MILELTKLSDKEYRQISGLVYSKFGINLGEQKKSLIAGRLNKVLHQNGFETFEQYYNYLVADQSGKALTTLIDHISTNHTFFYRENDHFEYLLSTALPEITAQLRVQKRNDLRIWCAGCSTGEEPYTLAMMVKEHLGNGIANWDVGILATDISSRALDIATEGIYTTENISHLPAALKYSYFQKHGDGNWKAKSQLVEMITFRRLNLMRDAYPFRGKFQVIFCRNVMIYFDRPTRDKLLDKFSRYFEPKGYLFIGHSESLGQGNGLFDFINPAIYRKRHPA